MTIKRSLLSDLIKFQSTVWLQFSLFLENSLK